MAELNDQLIRLRIDGDRVFVSLLDALEACISQGRPSAIEHVRKALIAQRRDEFEGFGEILKGSSEEVKLCR